MNKILTTSIVAAIAVMMVGGVMPAIAQPDIQPDSHTKGHDTGIPLKYDPRSCTKSKDGHGPATCTVYIDIDDDGCDRRDNTIEMPIQAIKNANIPECGRGGPAPPPK